ncbi:MAG: hypothetical protein WBR17_10790, partial [Paraburkholderia sp.]|uniref:hypothetical protein n=1 Tax=Paraburkholderia sp. TaxID=1926495 RepID=UPI003C4F2F41
MSKNYARAETHCARPVTPVNTAIVRQCGREGDDSHFSGAVRAPLRVGDGAAASNGEGDCSGDR